MYKCENNQRTRRSTAHSFYKVFISACTNYLRQVEGITQTRDVKNWFHLYDVRHCVLQQVEPTEKK
ncbi:MAG: hypothetical protein AYK18_18000 [Theionarchaea archaeon DG-70]|nr:MAG: hypothetical protein AYK18_18000 [Theionarchaea archaeon DG-70]